MTPIRSRPLFATVALGVLASSAFASPAMAQDEQKQKCISAYEQAQSMRQSGQLRAAREQALFCAQDSCPEVVRNDCATWLGEIVAGTPTVTFEVRDLAGASTTRVKVEFDGALLKDGLDGKAVPVDPGEHTFRFLLGDDSTGAEPEVREMVVVIREGEKNRKLEVAFGEPPPPDPGTAPSGPVEQDEGIPIATIVLGGVGVVGIGMFAAFALIGTSEKSDLENDCAPNCAEDEVDSVRTKFIVGDVSLAVGVVSLAAAAIIWATSGGSSAQADVAGLTIGVTPTFGGFLGPSTEAAEPSGGAATVSGRF